MAQVSGPVPLESPWLLLQAKPHRRSELASGDRPYQRRLQTALHAIGKTQLPAMAGCDIVRHRQTQAGAARLTVA